MKKTFNLTIAMSLVVVLGMLQSVQARTVEIEVYGMTCAFCVDSLERKFSYMQSISNVEVSLKQKKIRLQTEENKPSIESIKKAVLEAGFTPVKITVLADEK